MFSEAKITQTGADKYNVSYGDDSGVFAQFFWDAVQDDEATRLEGRPVYRNLEMVRIMFPGDNTKVVERKVRRQPSGNQPSDIDRFAKQWAAFQAQQEQVSDGTPLEHWPPLDKASILNLKARNIHTVEQLAGISDVNLSFMGARQMRDNAKAWLEEANSGGKVIAQQGEIQALKRQLEAMQNTINGMRTEAAPTAPPPPASVDEAAEPSVVQNIKPIKTRMSKKDKADGENPAGVASSGSE
jgi:transposase-like protein